MDERLFKIVLILIALLCSIITGYIVPYIKQNIDTTKMDNIMRWVIEAVKAAEMIFTEPKSGDEKREYVIDFIANMFNKNKEVITEEQIVILLESAVQQLKNGTLPKD